MEDGTLSFLCNILLFNEEIVLLLVYLILYKVKRNLGCISSI